MLINEEPTQSSIAKKHEMWALMNYGVLINSIDNINMYELNMFFLFDPTSSHLLGVGVGVSPIYLFFLYIYIIIYIYILNIFRHIWLKHISVKMIPIPHGKLQGQDWSSVMALPGAHWECQAL